MSKHKTSTGDRVVTRADVARYAGVSTAVVSYVINGGPRKVAQPIPEMARTAVQLVLDQPRPEGYTAFAGSLSSASRAAAGKSIQPVTKPAPHTARPTHRWPATCPQVAGGLRAGSAG